MKLEDKFRQRLLGHLSDANTEVDVRVAVDICKSEILSFISFLRENDFYLNQLLNDSVVEKALEIYLNKE